MKTMRISDVDDNKTNLTASSLYSPVNQIRNLFIVEEFSKCQRPSFELIFF